MPKEMKHNIVNDLVNDRFWALHFRFFVLQFFFNFDSLFGGLVRWFTVERFSRECSTASSTITEKFCSNCELPYPEPHRKRLISVGPADLTDILSCYVVNAHSLKKPNALQLLQTEMFACICDVAAVIDTWLSKAVDSTAIQIDCYTLHRNDGSGQRGGGIAVYVKERYNFSILSTANSHSGKLLGHELMWLRISKNAQIYIFGLVYHPPKPIYDSHDFTVNFLMISISLVAHFRKLLFTSLAMLTDLILPNSQSMLV